MSLTTTKKWKFVGGRICLDFVNSVGGRIDNGNDEYTILEDKLKSYEDLLEWGVKIGIMKEPTAKVVLQQHPQKKMKSIFIRALELRESLYRIFKNIIIDKQPPVKDLEKLNAECASAHNKQKLMYSDGQFTLDFESTEEPDIMILYAALSGEEILLTDQLHKIKECPGDNCGWLFLDTSKNGSRQWCDMKDCGNLVKVRRFREKK